MMTRLFIVLLVFASSLFAQGTVVDSIAAPVVETAGAPAEDSVAIPVAEPVAEPIAESVVEQPAVAPVADSTVAPVADSAAKPVAISTADSTAPQGATLSDEQIAKILMAQKPKYPRHLVRGFALQGGYSNNGGIDVSLGIMFPLSQRWPVSIGFEFLRAQIAADDFQVVSDETLLTMGVGVVVGGIAAATGSASKADEASTKTVSVPQMILGLAIMVPLYAWCGSLYVPVVPGAWLGVVDKSRMLTQVISEGFHKQSFTYQNDVGLRLSPLASKDGSVHGFVDGGVRFSKNFAADLEIYYFAHAGVALSF